MRCPSCQTSQPLSYRCGKCGAEMMRARYRAEPQGVAPIPVPATGTPFDNPYEAPQAALRATAKSRANDGALASRSARLAAVMIDSLCLMALTLPLVVVLAIVSEVNGGGEAAAGLAVLVSLAGLFGLLSYQVTILVRDGQTIGKKVMKIRIVDYTGGDIPSWKQILLMRYVVNGLLKQIPFYALADALLIFGDEKRCIHDHLAGTKVIEV